MLPLSPKFNLFAKAGYSIITSDLTGNTATYSVSGSRDVFYNSIVGAGAEYRVLPRLDLNAQYLAIIGVGNQYDTTNLITGGLNFYF